MIAFSLLENFLATTEGVENWMKIFERLMTFKNLSLKVLF